MKYKIKHLLEYGLLRMVQTVTGFMPYRLALFVGYCLAMAGAMLFPAKLRRARTRMRQVFGNELTERELRRYCWIAWRNLFFNMIENMRLHRLSQVWLDRHFDPGQCFAQLGQCGKEQGGIIAVPHMGNWELAGLACQIYGHPIVVVLGRQRNPLTNAYFRLSRERLGILALERGTESMRPIVRAIRKGRYLAILPDSRMAYPDISVPFLGGVANVGSGMAVFARMTKRRILPCLPVRIGWAHHRTVALEPVDPIITEDKAADIQAMTEAVIRQIDEGIRKHPEQWFWYNSRWILDPVDGQGSGGKSQESVNKERL